MKNQKSKIKIKKKKNNNSLKFYRHGYLYSEKNLMIDLNI